jgi:hypothetical protein
LALGAKRNKKMKTISKMGASYGVIFFIAGLILSAILSLKYGVVDEFIARGR